jgi:putative SOS response-associated peptidase YedK
MRAETVETKPFFRDAFKRTRCLIPLSGYYEWQATPGGKQPWYFTAADGSPLLTAAELWDEWKERASGEQIKSCTMIITEPNDFVAEVHDRMPVLLTEDQFVPWLRGEAGTEVLKPAPDDYLQRWSVSRRVNSSKADADDATLIERKLAHPFAACPCLQVFLAWWAAALDRVSTASPQACSQLAPYSCPYAFVDSPV